MKHTGYWTFFCNPKRWEIDRLLATNIEYDTYQITSWQADYFKKGQLGVVRVGHSQMLRTNLGLYLNGQVFALLEREK